MNPRRNLIEYSFDRKKKLIYIRDFDIERSKKEISLTFILIVRQPRWLLISSSR